MPPASQSSRLQLPLLATIRLSQLVKVRNRAKVLQQPVKVRNRAQVLQQPLRALLISLPRFRVRRPRQSLNSLRLLRRARGRSLRLSRGRSPSLWSLAIG